MNKLKILIIGLILLLTSGCWQYQELNDLGMVSTLGIDKIGNEYLVSVQIVNVKKLSKDATGSAEESPVTVYEGKGNTLGEALNKISLEAPKELYLGHIDVVVVGEETAKMGIKEFIDFLLRDREVRKIYPFVVAKGSKAVDVLKVLTPIETLPSTYIMNLLDNAQKLNGTLTNRTFDNVLMCLYVRGRNATTPTIEIINLESEGEKTEGSKSSAPTTKIVGVGPSVFIDDKLVGYLEGEESLGYNLIRKRVKSTVISFKCDNQNYGAVAIDTPKVNFKTEVKDDKPFVKVKMELTATLTDYNCELDLKKTENVHKVEKMVEDRFKDVLTNSILATQQKYKSDIMGFGENLYLNNYKYWLKVEKDWGNIYPNLEFQVDVKTTINNTGSTTIPAKEGGKGGNN